MSWLSNRRRTVSLNLQITSTDPNGTGDYIRDMHVVQQSLLPLYQAGLTFNPAFVSKIDDFSTLRYMNWMNTNESIRPKWQRDSVEFDGWAG